MKKERTLKVYESCGYMNKDVPTIILRGKWLNTYGFKIGHTITVSCRQGHLTIRLDNKKTSEQ